MKNNILIAISLFAISLGSCKMSNLKNAEVVKDCTGSYLKIDGQDFFVCNAEKLNDFKDGEEVQVTVNMSEECNLTGICLLYHPNSGYVEVTNIK